MTDGERLVWATSYALVFDRTGDAVAAARGAAFAVEQLRKAALVKSPGGEFAIKRVDEPDFLDEIVNVP